MTTSINQTAAFLGPETDWARAEIRLDDVHGLWGGQTLRITGAGRVALERTGPAFRAGQWETTLDEAGTHALFQQFIDHDFVALTLPAHTPIPDETHPHITLINARGQKHSLRKWARQTNEQFEHLYTALQAVADQAED